MKKTAALLNAILLVVLICGCKSEATIGPQPDNAKIFGQWEWQRSVGGISGGQVLVPAPGERIILKLHSDSQYSESKNDTVLSAGTYFIVKEKTLYSVDSLEVVYFEGNRRPLAVIWSLTEDSLMLGDNYADGFMSSYKKL